MSQTDKGVELPTKRTDASTLEQRLTDNAYQNIIPARYLNTDAAGDVIEEPEDLFERVAKNVAIAEAVYHDTDVYISPDHIKPDHPSRDELVEDVFGSQGEYSGDSVKLTEDNAKWVAYDPLVEDLEGLVLEQAMETKQAFQEQMERLKFMPNSPTLMNAGDQFQQLSACFVNSPADDMEDIYETLKESALVMQSGGGMGYAFSYLRPYGDVVGSSGGIASGPITFMRSFDQMCATISQGGTRRGAQMGVMRCTHPDLPFFLHAKNKDVSLAQQLLLNDPDDFTHNSFAGALQEAREIIEDFGGVPEHLRNAVEGHLSNFNISVAVTDEFMEAAQNDEMFEMINPRTGEPHVATEHTKELYDMFDLGEHVEVGEALSVPAREFLDRMADGAHENGEPGILFIDKANDDHSFPTESTPTNDDDPYEMSTTNPCGEQWLMEYEACNLGHINLSTLVNEDAPDWRSFDKVDDTEKDVATFLEFAIDWDELDERVRLGTRFLDNVVTMSNFEFGEDFDDIGECVGDNRKIGLGIMGLAQLFIQLGVEYGSEESQEIARQVMQYIEHESKTASSELAGERGVFENWADSKYADPIQYPEWFEQHTGRDPFEWEEGGFAIRNHNTVTIAPTGTTSMVGNTSGGCEPIYSVAHYKNVSDDVQGDEMLVEFDDYFLRVLDANGVDVEEAKKECEEQMANDEFDGVDGLETVPDAIGELFVTTSDLSGREHASIQCAMQRNVDSAISKTVNFPNDATVEDVQDVLFYLYDNGAKGATIYRDGSRTKQVLTTRQNNRLDDPDELSEREAENLIYDLADEHGFTITFNEGGQDVELADDTEAPAAVGREAEFATKRDRPDVLYGSTQRIDTGYGKLYVNVNEDEEGLPFELFANIGNSGGFTASFTEALAKMTSLALRAGVDPSEVADELEGIRSPKVQWDKGEQINSIPDAIGTGLRRHIEGELEGIEGVEAVEPDEQTNEAELLIQAGDNPECSECGAMLSLQEGCKKCESCGWSEC